MSDWQVNYKDGNGWQTIEEDAMKDEIVPFLDPAAANLQIGYDIDGNIKAITTPTAKYRRRADQAAPLETKIKVKIEEDGDILWAI